MPFLQGLAHRLQDTPFELRQLIEKQHAVVRQRDFAGSRIDVSAQQTGVAGGMVRRAEWALCDERLARREQANDAVNLRRFERLIQRQRRQDRRQPFCEHRLACAWRTEEQDVVSAGRGDFQRALDGLLTFHIGEIEFVLARLIEQSGEVHACR